MQDASNRVSGFHGVLSSFFFFFRLFLLLLLPFQKRQENVSSA